MSESKNIQVVNRVVRTAEEAEERNGVVNEEDIDDDLDVQVGDQVPGDSQQDEVDHRRAVPEERPTELKSGKVKSRFYMEPEPESAGKELAFRSEYVFGNEEKLADMGRVYCQNSLSYFSTVDADTKPNGKLPGPVDQEGRIELTNYCLRFMPSNQISDCFKTDRDHALFDLGQGLGFVIPLMHVLEIRGVGNTSDKLKKLSTASEVMVNVPRELLIKCKNFSTKYLIFSGAEKSVSQFAQYLLTNCNSSQLRNTRFQSLLDRLNYGARSAASKSRLGEGRKPYLRSTELVQDLDDCGCSGFMAVRTTAIRVQVFSHQDFIISTNMSCYAVPKDLDKVLGVSRVVVNESSVPDFATAAQLEQTRQSMYASANPSKKSGRFSEFLSGSKSSTLSSKQSAPSAMSANFPSSPLKAAKSSSNPFLEFRFPVWSFTNIYTGCSLIVVPEAQPTRQEHCDIIVKDYNALLYDELIKLKVKQTGTKVEKLLNVKRVDGEDYGEYEFFKFKVPFGYEKVQTHYYRLMQMCSYRTSLELYKETETFYSNLHGTKWLRDVSVVLGLASKMVSCLHVQQRNVFLEEDRANTDLSCVLVSLVRIMFEPRCRTIAGFENLIHKEWFLAGHKFYDRLLTTQPLKDDATEIGEAPSVGEDSTGKDTKRSIAPVFLLFLDCVFQLTTQYPEEFEFNEYYLIHLWDYALSGISYTFSFNGQNDWLSYVSRQSVEQATAGSMVSLDKIDEKLLRGLFEANNEFWHQHLDKNQALFVTKSNFSPSQSVLNPSDKIYVLKFWTRCYLRWYDIKHPYGGSAESPEPVKFTGAFVDEPDEPEEEETQETQSRKASRSSVNSSDRPPPYRPPPPPPTLPSPAESFQVPSEPVELPILRINIVPGTTRITSDGGMQTNL